MHTPKKDIKSRFHSNLGRNTFHGIDKNLINPTHLSFLSKSKKLKQLSNNLHLFNIYFQEIDNHLKSLYHNKYYYVQQFQKPMTWFQIKEAKNRTIAKCPICNNDYQIKVNNYKLNNLFCSDECKRVFNNYDGNRKGIVRLNQQKLIYSESKKVKLGITKSRLKYIQSLE